jgi:outer membrane protein insertion porin family
MSAFVDGGNVFSQDQSYDVGDLRYSAGLGLSWFSPFGPLKLVFAKALNPQPRDDLQVLQFQFGQQF